MGPIPPELGSLGNLEWLYLNNNKLSGRVPSELGNLGNLQRLNLSKNTDLIGSLPGSFSSLANLNTLKADGTRLCAPLNDDFQTWLSGVESRSGVNTCADAPDRTALIALYQATGGQNWENDEGWLNDGPLGEWYGVTTDDIGRVTHLDLNENSLQGTIPSTLDSLGELQWLNLSENQLSGTIPSELGNLSNLQALLLSSNYLSGTIPFGAWQLVQPAISVYR